MKVDISALDGMARGLRVGGEIDIFTVDSLEHAISALPRGPGPIVIECSEIDFMDSAGLGLLLRLVNGSRVNGSEEPTEVVIRNPSPALLRLFEIAVPGGVPGLAVEADNGGPASSGDRSDLRGPSPAVDVKRGRGGAG